MTASLATSNDLEKYDTVDAVDTEKYGTLLEYVLGMELSFFL